MRWGRGAQPVSSSQRGARLSSDFCRETRAVAAANNRVALGADRGILVETDEEDMQPLAIAKLLKAVIDKEQPQLIITGKQAIDDTRKTT